MWLAGIASDAVGFGLQTAALAHGSLLVVQPLLTTFLLFALGIGAAWSRQPLRRFEWLCALMVTSGLAVWLCSEEAGFVSAVSTIAGIVEAQGRTNLYALPRIAWDGRQRSIRMMRVLLSGITFAPVRPTRNARISEEGS